MSILVGHDAHLGDVVRVYHHKANAGVILQLPRASRKPILHQVVNDEEISFVIGWSAIGV